MLAKSVSKLSLLINALTTGKKDCSRKVNKYRDLGVHKTKKGLQFANSFMRFSF